MSSFILTIIFSLIMGGSIYFSLPIVMRRKKSKSVTTLLEAAAIGILIFVMADVFSNAAQTLYTGALYGFGADPLRSLIFATALAVGFFMLYFFENKSKRGLTQTKTALMIAAGIGLQNLTEGLVFGAASASIGLLSGVALVILVGFSLQDITEGFPIASPFMSKTSGKLPVLFVLFLVGGAPTVLGSAIGYFYSSALFNIFFYGLAVGAILYVMLPMIKGLLKNMDPLKQKTAYTGIFIGFFIGFLVNLI